MIAGDEPLFAAIDHPKERTDYWFVFCSERMDVMWIMTSGEFIKSSYQNRTGRNVQQLRYQLLTATAAVLEEAKRQSSARAVLIVHEFLTPLTLSETRERNAADLDRFLAIALDRQGHLAPGDVAGPILVKGPPTLYVGRARTVV